MVSVYTIKEIAINMVYPIKVKFKNTDYKFIENIKYYYYTPKKKYKINLDKINPTIIFNVEKEKHMVYFDNKKITKITNNYKGKPVEFYEYREEIKNDCILAIRMKSDGCIHEVIYMKDIL